MSPFTVRPMLAEDVAGAMALQKLAFPPPFSEDLHWDPEHLEHHIKVFPQGQFVAELEGRIVGTCSNAIIPEERWQAHENWGRTVGGPYIRNHTEHGSTLYGLDITVAPEARKMGIGRAFYQARFDLVRRNRLTRYGTGCRMPDYQAFQNQYPNVNPDVYALFVLDGKTTDRTLSVLIRYGLRFKGVIKNYMPDEESGNAAALLEWLP